MNSFSISQLASFSGLKAHTIRIWEQRYHALQPSRTKGNTRYYDNEQLRRLLNIVTLAGIGYKISELCVMPDKKLYKLLEQLKPVTGNETDEYFVAQLISAGISYDEPGFEKIFSHCVLRYGMKDTYLKIIYPVLTRMGFMWSSDTIPPAHEHFISNLIRQKLLTAIDSLPTAKPEYHSWLLFLPENEFHEIGLLFANYLIRFYGRKVIYLGSNLPFQSLKLVLKNTSPTNILLFFAHHDLPDDSRKYLNKLSTEFTGKNIFVASHQKFTEQLGKINKIRFLHSVDELIEQMTYVN